MLRLGTLGWCVSVCSEEADVWYVYIQTGFGSGLSGMTYWSSTGRPSCEDKEKTSSSCCLTLAHWSLELRLPTFTVAATQRQERDTDFWSFRHTKMQVRVKRGSRYIEHTGRGTMSQNRRAGRGFLVPRRCDKMIVGECGGKGGSKETRIILDSSHRKLPSPSVSSLSLKTIQYRLAQSRCVPFIDWQSLAREHGDVCAPCRLL